jgi:hypothetical protein
MNEFQLTPEKKLESWGDGEWVTEPDEYLFIYRGYDCKIKRNFILEGYKNEHLFGGHLCGYVCVPDELKLAEKECDVNLDVHGGITYNEIHTDNKNWIGFDCAHCFDYCPSTEYLHKTHPEFIKMKEESKKRFGSFGIDYDTSPINQKSYKTIEFCIAQCKYMVDQLIQMRQKSAE